MDNGQSSPDRRVQCGVVWGVQGCTGVSGYLTLSSSQYSSEDLARVWLPDNGNIIKDLTGEIVALKRKDQLYSSVIRLDCIQ